MKSPVDQGKPERVEKNGAAKPKVIITIKKTKKKTFWKDFLDGVLFFMLCLVPGRIFTLLLIFGF